MTKIVPVARLLMLLVAAAALAPTTRSQGKPAKTDPKLVAVVKVDDEYQIIPKDDVDALKKKLAEEHKAALDAHKEAAKQAKKDKKPFTDAAPKEKKLKVIKPSVEEAAAEALVAELKDKDAKKGKPKDKDKPKPKADPKPKKDPKK